MNESVIIEWGREFLGWWLLLGLVTIVVEGARRIITDPRAFVKSVARRVRIPLAILISIAAAFATFGAFLWHGDWWLLFEGMLMLVVVIAAQFASAIAPILVLDKLLAKRKRQNQQPPQVSSGT